MAVLVCMAVWRASSAARSSAAKDAARIGSLAWVMSFGAHMFSPHSRSTGLGPALSYSAQLRTKAR